MSHNSTETKISNKKEPDSVKSKTPKLFTRTSKLFMLYALFSALIFGQQLFATGNDGQETKDIATEQTAITNTTEEITDRATNKDADIENTIEKIEDEINNTDLNEKLFQDVSGLVGRAKIIDAMVSENPTLKEIEEVNKELQKLDWQNKEIDEQMMLLGELEKRLQSSLYGIDEQFKKIEEKMAEAQAADINKIVGLEKDKQKLTEEREALLSEIAELKKTETQYNVLLQTNEILLKKYIETKDELLAKKSKEALTTYRILYIGTTLFALLFLASRFVSGKRTKKIKAKHRTKFVVIKNSIPLVYVLFLAYIFVRLNPNIMYFGLLFFSAIVIGFKAYLSNIIDFYTDIIFKYKIGTLVSYKNSIGVITSLTPIQAVIELYDEEMKSLNQTKYINNTQFSKNVTKIGNKLIKEYTYTIETMTTRYTEFLKKIQQILENNTNHYTIETEILSEDNYKFIINYGIEKFRIVDGRTKKNNKDVNMILVEELNKAIKDETKNNGTAFDEKKNVYTFVSSKSYNTIINTTGKFSKDTGADIEIDEVAAKKTKIKIVYKNKPQQDSDFLKKLKELKKKL